MMRIVFIVFSFFITTPEVHALPTFEQTKAAYKKSDAVLLDRHGEVIHEMRTDLKGRRLDWTELKNISTSLIKAVIYSEDRRFYNHHGIDWASLGAVIIKNIFTDKKRGASTITMQLASILNSEPSKFKSKKTLSRKWEQIKTAQDIEAVWTKDEILEAYFNLITFRGELQGISAASRGLFNKEPGGLNEAESSLLAVLIRSPNASVNEVSKRACLLSSLMKGTSSCKQIEETAELTIPGHYNIKPHIALAPHVARELLTGNTKAVSSLDGKLQRFASDLLQRHLSVLKNQNVRDGALLVVHNKTGEILAYVANLGSSSSARHVDGVLAKRQAGSTLKPFLYGLAIEKNLLTAASMLDDSPLNVPTLRGMYVPKNYDSDFKGYVSVRTALSSSLNIPAVRALMLVGTEDFAARLRSLGFEDINDGDYYGLSMALGSVDVSLYELVNAYRTIANSGKWSGLTLNPNKKNDKSKQAVNKEAAFIISDILSDREARSATFGFENPLSTRFWSAVKTGTSKDMRDNWCVGFSEKYTVGIWVGNFYGEPMWNVSGISGAAPVWYEIMNYLHRNSPSNAPQMPAGVVAAMVAFEGDMEHERREWFIKGTESELRIKNSKVDERPKIIYPAAGSVIAIDPDIPDDNQLIAFQFEPSFIQYEWALNNKKTGVKNPYFLWKPESGRHRISLFDNNGLVLDAVEFTVR